MFIFRVTLSNNEAYSDEDGGGDDGNDAAANDDEDDKYYWKITEMGYNENKEKHFSLLRYVCKATLLKV